MRESERMRNGLLSLIKRLPAGLEMVEVGCFRGESAELFARSGKFTRIHCVDPWPARMVTAGGVVIDGARIESLFDQRTGDLPVITKVKGYSVQVARDFPDVDFVYIDADHRYAPVKADLEAWLPRARRFIGGHDFNLDHPGVIKAVTERFRQPIQLFWDTSWLVRLPAK